MWPLFPLIREHPDGTCASPPREARFAWQQKKSAHQGRFLHLQPEIGYMSQPMLNMATRPRSYTASGSTSLSSWPMYASEAPMLHMSFSA